jgi:CRISPR-associated protein Cas2
MRLVVCYDVVQDRRRAKLHKRLRDFLEPVQKSVFEGDLPARRLPDLIEAVDLVIDHEVDNVRVYELCRGCVGLVVHRGVAHEVRDPDADTFA